MAASSMLARVTNGAATPTVLVAAILGLDRVQFGGAHAILVNGLLDEPAHLATAALALLALAGGPRLLRNQALAAGALAVSVLLDLDHVPLYLGVPQIADGGRPYSHSLTTALLLSAAWLLTGRRPWLAGAALGVALHFTRDVVTGPGLPLCWPLTRTEVRLPYGVYVAVLGVLAVVATLRAHRSGQTSVLS